MTLTKKSIEKEYGIRLIRDKFNCCDGYMSWKAFVDDLNGNETEIAWSDTLGDLIKKLDGKIEEIKELKIT